MKLIPFLASSAVEAAAQIRDQLGPEAIVVHVRPIPPVGLTRLWRRSRFEVLAYRPEPGSNPAADRDTAEECNRRWPEGSLDVRTPSMPATVASRPSIPAAGLGIEPALGSEPDGWSVGHVLESAGLLAVNAQRVVDQLQRRHGPNGAPSLPEQLDQARQALTELWRRPLAPVEATLRPHVLVGPPGVGKTTCLCKWLTQIVLLEGKAVHLWRLDGATANTAESLDVYCEALGVPVSRSWRIPTDPTGQVHFIDLPGVDWRDAAALQQLTQQIRGYLSPQVHVVLNGAYDTDLLVAQVRAFGVLPVEDLIITHLDEETRWAKFWNLALGTNFPIRFLSAGQNIPGDFHAASPDRLFSRSFSS